MALEFLNENQTHADLMDKHLKVLVKDITWRRKVLVKMHYKWKLESNLFLRVDWEEKESCNHLQSCQGQSRELLQLLYGSNILLCCLRSPEMYICYSFKEWKWSCNMLNSLWSVLINIELLLQSDIFCIFPIIYTIDLPFFFSPVVPHDIQSIIQKK